MPVTEYMWDELNDSYLMETDEIGTTTAVYTNEPVQFGNLVSQRRGNATSYYHFDQQGSTRQLTDGSQNQTDAYTYTAFGETVAKTGTTANPFGYKCALGYYVDPETADLYVRRRTYQAPLARWTSRLPIDIGRGLNHHAGPLYLALNCMNRPGTCFHRDPMRSIYSLKLNEPLESYSPAAADAPGWWIFDPVFTSDCDEQAIWAFALAVYANPDHIACGLPWSLPPHRSMPYQHCLWQCRLARYKGEMFAEACATLKEQADATICNIADSIDNACWAQLSFPLKHWLSSECCSAWQPSDLRDNAVGRFCGKYWCRGWPFPCATCCRLLGIDPNREEGYGTDRPYGPRCTARYAILVEQEAAEEQDSWWRNRGAGSGVPIC